MARSLKCRGVVATAIALASGSSLVLAAAPAGAASATQKAPAYYAGSTSGDVLGLTLNLPTAVAGLPNPLQIGLIHVDGSALHDPLKLASKTVASAESTASLASGNLVTSLQKTLGVNLDRVAHVQLGSGADTQTTNLLDVPVGDLADVSVSSLTASLNKATDSTTSSANGVGATLGTLNDLLGASTVSTAQSAVQPVVTQLVSTLNQILSTVQGVTGSNVAVETVTDTVDALLAKAKNLVANLGTTPLISVDVHDTSQTVSPEGDAAVATSKLGLVSVNLLGGLLTVNGFSSGATATATGVAGGAHVTSFANKPIVSVNAADALCAQLTTGGINLCKSAGLPASVQATVNSLLSQVSSLLTTLESKVLNGVISISEVPGTSHTSSNGRSASVTAPGYAVNVANIAKLVLGSNVSAAIEAAQAPKVVKVPNAVPLPKSPATPKGPVELPHTGADLGLFGMGALLLIGGAAVLRRRVLGTPEI